MVLVIEWRMDTSPIYNFPKPCIIKCRHEANLIDDYFEPMVGLVLETDSDTNVFGQ